MHPYETVSDQHQNKLQQTDEEKKHASCSNENLTDKTRAPEQFKQKSTLWLDSTSD